MKNKSHIISRVVEGSIADELGIKVVSIHPLSYDWAEEMIRVAQALKH